MCMRDMDTKEKRQRLTAGIWNEMLQPQQNTWYTLAAEITECRDKATTWNQKKCYSADHGKETKAIRPHLQDGWQLIGEGCGVRDDGRKKQARKAKQSVSV